MGTEVLLGFVYHFDGIYDLHRIIWQQQKGRSVPALLLDPCFSFWTGVKHAHCSESRKGGCSVGSAWMANQLLETGESCEEAAFDAKLPVSCESVLCEIQLHDNSTGCIHVFNRKAVFDSLLLRQCNRLSPPFSPHSKCPTRLHMIGHPARTCTCDPSATSLPQSLRVL